MKKTRVAINGLGRIGRAFFKMAWDRAGVEIVAVNDLGDIDNLVYLLKYDTINGRWRNAGGLPHDVRHEGDHITLDGRQVKVLQERDPSKLPWGDLGVDVVIESTGVFTHYEKAKMHLDAGAKRVVISAPAKGEAPKGVTAATVLMGVNEDKLAACQMTSNGSCTTNAASPIIAVLEGHLDIEKALLDTIHGYTATQNLQDGPSKKDPRRGRAAAMNIIPTTTGAAKTVTQAVEGVPFFDGISVRVPVVLGSYVDLTFTTAKDTSAEEINQILRDESKEDNWQGILRVSDEPLVSSDIIGDTYASIVDAPMTRVVGGNLCKVLAWYDNEAGYTHTLLEHACKLGATIK